MESGEELQPLLAHGALHLSYDVAARSHAGRVPAIDVAIPHGKAVSVFGNRPDISRAGIFEQCNPGIGI